MKKNKAQHFDKFSIVEGGIKVKLDMSRFDKQLRRAQYELDGNVMNSMVPFMPHLNGTFIQVTRAESASVQGTGEVYAAFGPHGRYLYEGKVMVDSETGKGPRRIPIGPGEYILRFRKGAKLIKTNRPLQYSKKTAKDHWFDAAKKKDGKQWIKDVKKTAGGGKRG